jgi:SAM-dependent methyltransferase
LRRAQYDRAPDAAKRSPEKDMPTPEEMHQAQIAYWNSPAGEKWLKRQAETDASIAPAQAAAMVRAAPRVGEHVLDIGCGCGASTIELGERVGRSGRVVGADVSEAMIGRARERTTHLPQVETLCADAARFRFPAQSFDLMFSRFGVMFFGDPVAAFAHLRGALKPDGRLVFACWRPIDENPWMRVPLRAVCKHVPRPARPGPEEPGPFSFADTQRVNRILTQAGFAAPEIAPFDFDMDIAGGRGLDAAVESASTIGAAGAALNDQPQDLRDKAIAELRNELAGFEKDGSVLLGAAVWIVQARPA